MLEKVKGSLDKGVAAVSIKSSEFIEINKLKTQISGIESEIKGKKQELGAAVYNRWKSGEFELSDIEELCQEMKADEGLIESFHARIEELQELNKRILSSANDEIACKCGQKNAKSSKFCRNCGEKLEPVVPEEPQQQSDTKACACGAVLNVSAKFCRSCGKKLEPVVLEKPQQQPDTKVCACGTVVKAFAKFCPKCGHKFETQPVIEDVGTAESPEQPAAVRDEQEATEKQNSTEDITVLLEDVTVLLEDATVWAGDAESTQILTEEVETEELEEERCQCGAERKPGAKFCPKCGARLG